MTEQEMLIRIIEHTNFIVKHGLNYEAFEIIQTKWYGRILLELCKKSPMRFGELKKALPEITNVVLTAALKALVEKGLLTREQFNEIPPHVEYALTNKGRDMLPIFYEMICWEEKHRKV